MGEKGFASFHSNTKKHVEKGRSSRLRLVNVARSSRSAVPITFQSDGIANQLASEAQEVSATALVLLSPCTLVNARKIQLSILI